MTTMKMRRADRIRRAAEAAAAAAAAADDASRDSGLDLGSVDGLSRENSALSLAGDVPDEENPALLAKKETWAVKGLKALVLCVLFLSAQGVSVALYMYVRHSETYQFETSFRNDATKLLASFGANLDLTLSSADTMAVSIVSNVKESGQTWPFITIPNFAIRAGKVRDSTVALMVNIYVYVQPEERPAWENFTAQPANHYWVDESIDIQARNPHYKGPITREYTSFNVIHGYDEYDKVNGGEFGTDRTGPYMVYWQCYPVVAFDPVYNWDLFTSFLSSGFQDALAQNKVVIREPYMVWSDSNSAEQKAYDLAEAEWLKNYVDPGKFVCFPSLSVDVTSTSLTR
jgi:hypothetical protein